MNAEIELVSDDRGVLLAGTRVAINRALVSLGLSERAMEVPTACLQRALQTGAHAANAAAEIAEHSAVYLKLTPESAAKLKDAGGLMKTDTPGISHAMLGKTGTASMAWLQVEDGLAPRLTSPAVLSGLGGLLSRMAQQAEAQELKALLIRIDEKLDDVRREQRNSVLAKLNGAALAIAEAMTIHAHGGDPQTIWAKVQGSSTVLLEVQSHALSTLSDLADKIESKRKTGDLKRTMREVEQAVVVQLAILARCFELHNEFRVVELDYVMATSPERLDGHRLGVDESQRNRQAAVLARTGGLLERMEVAGGIANGNVLLHARAAGSIINSLNATATSLAQFHEPLGIDDRRDDLSRNRWVAALRDPSQLKTAGAELGQKAAVVGIAAGVLATARHATDGKAK